MKRIHSVDVTRGIVMVIMALDHVRDLMHVDSITQSPTNLDTTTPLLFFTRWITYLCAPAFVFLAGTSVYISLKKTNDIKATRNFLIKRGCYLIALEFLVVNLFLFFDPAYHTLLFEVIAAIGVGFIILGLLLKASPLSIGIIGFIILFGHNLSSLISLAENSAAKTLFTLLFNPAAIPVSPTRVFVMAYPPVPWLGVMLLGFASGKLFELAEDKRKGLFIKIGGGAILLFAGLRFINGYGDPAPWLSQKTPVFSFLSFMNVTKYAPSLLFCLITLGIMFLMLAFTEKAKNSFTQILAVYGKVPLFYFLIHFLFIHLLLIGLLFMQGFSWEQMAFASGTFGRPAGVESGVALWAIYLIWMAVVVILYRPCLWYGRYKSTHSHWWLKYL